jgi:hypothetical protein
MAVKTFTLTVQIDTQRPNPQRIAAQAARDVAMIIEMLPTFSSGTPSKPKPHDPGSIIWTVT